MTRCDVCAARVDRIGEVCSTCLTAGHDFARRWIQDLVTSGLHPDEAVNVAFGAVTMRAAASAGADAAGRLRTPGAAR
jgi:hypothetical protein